MNMDFITQKEGPLPVWAWVGIGAAAWFLILRKKGSSTAASGGTVLVPQSNGGGGGSPIDMGGGGSGGGGTIQPPPLPPVVGSPPTVPIDSQGADQLVTIGDYPSAGQWTQMPRSQAVPILFERMRRMSAAALAQMPQNQTWSPAAVPPTYAQAPATIAQSQGSPTPAPYSQ